MQERGTWGTTTLKEQHTKRFSIIGTALVLALLFLSSCGTGTGQPQKDIERSGAVTLAGEPLTLLGPELKVGQKAPDFKLVAPYDRVENSAGATEVELAQSKGKVRLISVVPSLDTPVCDLQTQRFEEEAGNFQQIAFYTISMDLPFAQARYCGAKNVTLMEVLSDYREGSFGRAYGVLIKELNLLTRAIFVVDKDDTVRYVQYVKEVSQHPDYDAALTALRGLVGASPVQPTPTIAASPTGSPVTQTPPTTPAASQGPQAGSPAPGFRLTGLDGKPVSLVDLKGKAVLLNFWATW